MVLMLSGVDDYVSNGGKWKEVEWVEAMKWIGEREWGKMDVRVTEGRIEARGATGDWVIVREV